jgi:sulfofructosephosphate aldolase
MSLKSQVAGLRALRRPCGAFAIVALDQRESVRAMFAAYQQAPVTDQQIADFKLQATRALTPYASGVLIDRQFAWERVVREGAVAPGCGLIAAADQFISSGTEVVGESVIDEEMIPEQVKRQGAVAMKLLVVWRPDEPADKRLALVERFVRRCREAGLASIIEPVSRKPKDEGPWDWNAGVLLAAKELGNCGADLYKAEMPLHGEGDETAIRNACSALTRAIHSPWVVLSSGVKPDNFPCAVELACREGASGFLAGRAVWSGVIGSPDLQRALREDATARLRRLCDVVDRAVAR